MTHNIPTRTWWQIRFSEICNLLTLCTMFLFLGFGMGQHIKAHAQVQSAHDAVQDERILVNSLRTEAMNASIERLEGRIRSTEQDISTARGFGLALGGLVTLLQLVSMVMQYRVRHDIRDGN